MIKGVSCCCFFKDEEGQLGKSIPSWLPFCEELVLVDTGSTDRSREVIAEALGDSSLPLVWPHTPDEHGDLEVPSGHAVHLHLSPWRDDFSWHSNETYKLATQPWIFRVDADEVLEGDPEALAYFIGGVNQLSSPRPPLAVSFWESEGVNDQSGWWHPRLFRWSEGWAYKFKAHPQIIPPPGVDRMINLPVDVCRIHSRSPARDSSLERRCVLLEKELARPDLTDEEREHYERNLRYTIEGHCGDRGSS